MIQHVLHCVRENKKTATDSQHWVLSKKTQYLTTAYMIDSFTHNVTTHMSCNLELLIFSSFDLYSNFDTIVFQTVLHVDVLCGEEICPQCLISGRRGGRRKGMLHQRGEYEQPKRTPLPHLSVNLSFPGKWSHFLISLNTT